MKPRLTDLHPHEAWIASGAALDAAYEWNGYEIGYETEEMLLDAYLGTAIAADDYDEWCRQERHDHAADMRDEARERGEVL